MYLQPSEVERLPYWQYEILVEELEDLNKKEKEEQENPDQKGYKLPNGMKLPSKSDMQSGNYSGMKLPKVTMPKMPSLPKL